MLTNPNEIRVSRRRWSNLILYGSMVFIVLGLLWLLHIVGAIQDSQSPEQRLELAQKVIGFEIPEGYRLTSALYALHPRFFVLTHAATNQRIRVMERRWWAGARTPESFRSKFWHPGQRVSKPANFGYASILVEATGEWTACGRPMPYVTGLLETQSAAREQGLVACLYDSSENKSIYVFGSAPAEVFNVTEVLQFVASLKFRGRT